MEGSVYSNLGLKMNRTFKEKREDQIFTLKDFIDHKWIINSSEELKKTFSRELKSVLLKENIFDLISAFFELENDINQVIDLVDFEVKPFSFDELYKNLSPVLMRALLENAHQSNNAPQILKTIKESLRIAMEEELYHLDDLF